MGLMDANVCEERGSAFLAIFQTLYLFKYFSALTPTRKDLCYVISACL